MKVSRPYRRRDEGPCEGPCETAFQKAAGALLAKNTCPACLREVPLKQWASMIESGVDQDVGLVACAGTVPFGDEDPGFAPPDRPTAKCEFGVGRSLGRLAVALLRCHRQAAQSAFKGEAFDEEGCEDAATSTYDTATATLTRCPPCLDRARAGMQVRSDADAGNGSIYCALPAAASTGVAHPPP